MKVLRIARLPKAGDLPLPAYKTAQAAGMDIGACVEGSVTIAPGERVLIPTGLVMALAPGFEAQIRPRSGLALNHGITVLNAPGTIDADYRGELQILLINHGHEDFILRRGERIAQIVISPFERVSWAEEDYIDPGETRRGESGYGSTGVE